MSARHHSFTLSRPGLKTGFYVPARLRIVDTLTVLSSVPQLSAAFAFAMGSFQWVDQIGLGVIWRFPIPFFVYAGAVLLATNWTLSVTTIATLRFVFRITGMMTKAEAQYYPLLVDQECVGRWPEAWQKPDVRSLVKS